MVTIGKGAGSGETADTREESCRKKELHKYLYGVKNNLFTSSNDSIRQNSNFYFTVCEIPVNALVQIKV